MQQKYYLHIQNIDIHEIIIIQYSQLNQILPISIVLQIQKLSEFVINHNNCLQLFISVPTLIQGFSWGDQVGSTAEGQDYTRGALSTIRNSNFNENVKNICMLVYVYVNFKVINRDMGGNRWGDAKMYFGWWGVHLQHSPLQGKPSLTYIHLYTLHQTVCQLGQVKNWNPI